MVQELGRWLLLNSPHSPISALPKRSRVVGKRLPPSRKNTKTKRSSAPKNKRLRCSKAISEYESGNIEAGIILVNSLHAQEWQRPLYQYPFCLVNHRIKFISGEGEPNQNPTFQNMFVYLGRDKQRFADVFSQWGYVAATITITATVNDGIPEFLRKAEAAP